MNIKKICIILFVFCSVSISKAEIKNSKIYYSNGNKDEDNQVAKQLINTIKNLSIAINYKINSFVEDEYIYDPVNGRILGLKFKNPAFDNVNNKIIINWDKNNIVNAKMDCEIDFDFIWNKDKISEISIDGRVDFKFKLEYDKGNYPIRATQVYKNGNSTIYEIEYYDNSKLKEVTEYSLFKKKKSIKKKKKYSYNNDQINTQIIYYTYKKKEPIEFYNKEFNFSSLGGNSYLIQSLDNTDINKSIFDDKGRISQRVSKNKYEDFTKDYTYLEGKLFKIVDHCHNKEKYWSKNISKIINVFFTDKNKSSISNNNYDFIKGKYGFNTKGELIYKTDPKGGYREKIDGVWSDLKFHGCY